MVRQWGDLVLKALEGEHPFADKPHHGPRGFLNPPSPHQDGRASSGMGKVLWQLAREGNRSVAFRPEDAWSREQALAGVKVHEGGLSGIPLTWLGQSCFYFRSGPLRVVTDPFLGARASPFRFSGPRRLAPRPLTMADLDFDVIVMSHNHYDHFCKDTLASVKDKHNRLVVTTVGLAAAFRALGYRHVYELDWYQQLICQGVSFTALPAYHFSGRSLWDTNRTLWASFAIQGPDSRFFFAGDTGYGPEFARMGQLMGGFDIGLVPIGAYGPREIFSAVHADPMEAVKMGRDVNARHLVGMHWGTLRLTTEPFWEPREDFLRHLDEMQVSGSVLGIGETRVISV